MKFCSVYILLLLIVNNYSFSNNKVFTINDTTKIYPVYDYVYTFEDPEKNLTINEIIQNDNYFKPLDQKSINFSYSESAFWTKFTLKNQKYETIRLIFSISNPDMNDIEFYEYDGSAVTKTVITGENRKFNTREIPNRNFLFDLKLKPGITYTYYIRSCNQGDTNFLPISLENYESFSYKDHNQLIINGFIFGIFLFIILLNIFLSITIKGRIYIYYTLHVLFMSLFLFNLEGLSYQLLWPNLPWWSNHSIVMFVALISLFILMFSQLFLRIKDFAPVINRIFNFLKIVSLILFILSFFNYPVFLFAIKSVSINIFITIVIVTISGIIAARKKHISAYYLLSAYFITIIGVLFYQFRDLGLLADNFVTSNGIKLGMVTECLVLSFALVDSFRRQQRDARMLLQVQKSEIEEKKTALEKEMAVRKVAEEKKTLLESQLRQAQKMETIGRLAGGIAHDFNNILTPIIGYTELAMEGMKKNSTEKNDLNLVLKGANRAKDLVKQILTSSRQDEQEKIPVHVHLIVKEALKLIEASLPATIQVKKNIDTKSGHTMADPTQLHQVVMNICTNAAQSMQKNGGILEVRLDVTEITDLDEQHKINLKKGRYIRLTISDNGHGMSREVMERIFDPFFTTKDVGKGTGLGLSVVHGIVSVCDGDVQVYSEEDKGTTLSVYLPKVDISGKEEEIQKVAEIPGGNENILFVDDEKDIGILVKRMLEKLGYNITVFSDSRKALEDYKTNYKNYDLVITDQTMPGMTGDQLAENIINLTPDAKIILITGFGAIITELKIKNTGIKEYVNKPLIINKFAGTIRKVLDE